MTEHIIQGVGLGLILTLSVGPVIFAILKQSLNNGHQGGFAFVAGVWLSDILLVFVCNMFSEMVRQLLQYRDLIAGFGSLFITGMGVFYVFFKRVGMAGQDIVDLQPFGRSAFVRTAFAGFLINTLNPSVILFWLINATAFAAGNDLAGRAVIFGVCLLVNMASDVAKVLMAGRIRARLTAGNILLINRISGSILIAFGAVLLYGALASGD